MVQRSPDNAAGDHPSPPSMPRVEQRSLPVPDVRNGGGGAPPIGVQRSFDGPSTTATVSSRSVVQRGGGDALQPSPAAARNSRVEPDIGHSDPGSIDSPLDSDAGVHPEPIQRLELPVVSHDLTVGDARPPTPYSTNAAAVQRAATGGRVVVLPPVRRTASAPSVSDSPPASPVRSVLAESTRPIGLQRMFEGAVRSDLMPRRSGESSDGPTRAIEPRGDDVAANRFTGFQDHGDSGAHYDTATNTITFGAPTIQRAPDSTPPAEASTETPPVSASPSTALSVAPATTSAEPNVDELVNRLYDPLAARLRAELWLDRERAGVLMDLGR
jgi:hypothetical protein